MARKLSYALAKYCMGEDRISAASSFEANILILNGIQGAILMKNILQKIVIFSILSANAALVNAQVYEVTVTGYRDSNGLSGLDI